MYESKTKPIVTDMVYGLGGRDITPPEITSIYEEALIAAKTGVVKEQVRFVGVRE